MHFDVYIQFKNVHWAIEIFQIFTSSNSLKFKFNKKNCLTILCVFFEFNPELGFVNFLK